MNEKNRYYLSKEQWGLLSDWELDEVFFDSLSVDEQSFITGILDDDSNHICYTDRDKELLNTIRDYWLEYINLT